MHLCGLQKENPMSHTHSGAQTLCRIISEKERSDHREDHNDPVAHPCQNTVETGGVSPCSAADGHSRDRIQNDRRDEAEIHRGNDGISETENRVSDQCSEIADPRKNFDLPLHAMPHERSDPHDVEEKTQKDIHKEKESGHDICCGIPGIAPDGKIVACKGLVGFLQQGAAMMGQKSHRVSVRLYRTRERLHRYLKKEGLLE